MSNPDPVADSSAISRLRALYAQLQERQRQNRIDYPELYTEHKERKCPTCGGNLRYTHSCWCTGSKAKE
jgi:hypothetical protein